LITWLRATGVAVERGERVFLCDPTWGAPMRARAEEIFARPAEGAQERDSGELGWLGIPSGGTGGGLKFARHDEVTLAAAVRGFCEHFGLRKVHAVGLLPMYHVSGLMARVRCAATGGTYVGCDWKSLQAGGLPALPAGDRVVSLVPTQLQRLLEQPEAVAWLRQFSVVFVGGGPVWPALAEAAARERLRVSLSYGMTETAAMVAALRPEEFLAGERSSGAVLPHARVTITAEGTVRVGGESLFHGYYPEWRGERDWVTEDLGEMDAAGRLRVSGRRDAMIITGGKKVQPAEVEAALRASGEFADVAVIGVPDAEWGEAVVACYPAGGRAPDVVRAATGLAAEQRPKRFVAMADWPRNAQGKVNRAALRAAAELDDR